MKDRTESQGREFTEIEKSHKGLDVTGQAEFISGMRG